MAGTLTISTLSDGTNSTSSTNCIRGSARAWATFNGTTAAISSSYNVSSITVVATGDFKVNFTNAMPSTAYAGVVTGEQLTCYGPTEFTTSYYRIGSYVPASGITVSRTSVSVAIFSS